MSCSDARDLAIFVVTTDGRTDGWTDSPITLPLHLYKRKNDGRACGV